MPAICGSLSRWVGAMASANGTRQLSDFDTEVIECRIPSIRHEWERCNPPEPKEGTRSAMGEQRSFLCVRCGSTKHEVWSRRTGERLGRPYYIHPEGYTRMSRDFTN